MIVFYDQFTEHLWQCYDIN